MKRTLACLIAVAAVLALAACDKLGVTPTSNVPTIDLKITPSSGKVPLISEIAIEVQNISPTAHCTMTTFIGPVESVADDISCKTNISRTFMVNTGVRVYVVDRGKKYQRTEFATITP